MVAVKRKTKAAKKRTSQVAYKSRFAKITPAMKKNPGYGIAHAAGQDAANRHAKAHGRTAWIKADYDIAVKEFNRLFREPTSAPKKKAAAPRKKVVRPVAKNNPDRKEIRAAVEKAYGRKVTEAEVSKALKAAIAIHDIPKKRDIQITHYRGKQNPSEAKTAARGAKAAIKIFDTNKDGDVDKGDVKRLKKGTKKKPAKKNPPKNKQFTFYVTSAGKGKYFGKYLGYLNASAPDAKAAHAKLKKQRPDLFNSSYRVTLAKPNPGILTALIDIGNLAVGAVAAMDIADRVTRKSKTKATKKKASPRSPKRNSGESIYGFYDKAEIKKTLSQVRHYHPAGTVVKFTNHKNSKDIYRFRKGRTGRWTAIKGPKKNPAGEMFESFHGRPSINKPKAVYAPYGTPAHTDELGTLLELIMADGRVIDFRREKTGRTYYANGKNTAQRPEGHIFIVGAPFDADKDPSIPLDEVRPIGTISSIVYLTKKDREDDKTRQPYKHPFKGPRPVLGIDRFGDAHVVGGGYKIRPEGIVD